MARLSATELADFTDAVDGGLADHWPSATVAGADSDFAALRRPWDVVVAQGWTELGSAGALDALIAALGRLGLPACPPARCRRWTLSPRHGYSRASVRSPRTFFRENRAHSLRGWR